MRKPACGIVFCYNEELIIEECLKHYLSQGIDLVVVDNQSTDSSMNIVAGLRSVENAHPGKIIDVVNIKTEGYQWQEILSFACDYMHKNLCHYEWILLIDADSFFYSPIKRMPILEFMDFVKKRGYNIIDGELHDFFPTERDDVSIRSAVERMRYCRLYSDRITPQHRIFLYHPSVDFHTYRGHTCLRDDARVFIVRFIYNHYKWQSYEHGMKKIFEERMPRFVERKTGANEHPHYLGMLPIKKDLIKPSEGLRYYDHERMLISKSRLFWIMRFRKFIEIFMMSKGWDKRPPAARYAAAIKNRSKTFFDILSYDKRFALYYLYSSFKEAPSGIKNMHSEKLKHWTASTREIIDQKPAILGLPRSFHFLMTNTCNARCVFCGQDLESRDKKEISIEKFEKMLSNIPDTPDRDFYFSGGGEPLLCSDLFRIIRCAKERSPDTRLSIVTNGLLAGRHAEELAQSGIFRLMVSVHGSTQMSNNLILRTKSQEDVFKNIAILNERLDRNKKKMHKVFRVTVSRSNIGELPRIIKKAADLKIDEVTVTFRRFYPDTIAGKDSNDSQESLFYDQRKYNDIIVKSKKLAGKLNISFAHEPLFLRRFKERPCLLPWTTMLIDWDGDVYPCYGGEVWFRGKVKSGAYNFGNLLKSHLNYIWNSDDYVRLRRTCGRYSKESFIPECKRCHNSICLKGPNVEYSHILSR